MERKVPNLKTQLKDRAAEIIQSAQQKRKKRLKTEQSPPGIEGTVTAGLSCCVLCVPKREEEERMAGKREREKKILTN